MDILLQVITSGRLWSILAGILGLISIILGRLAMARVASRIAAARLLAIISLVAGLSGVIVSGMHLASTTGGFGTGSGRLGAIVAIVVGLIGIVFGGLAFSRAQFNR